MLRDHILPIHHCRSRSSNICSHTILDSVKIHDLNRHRLFVLVTCSRGVRRDQDGALATWFICFSVVVVLLLLLSHPTSQSHRCFKELSYSFLCCMILLLQRCRRRSKHSTSSCKDSVSCRISSSLLIPKTKSSAHSLTWIPIIWHLFVKIHLVSSSKSISSPHNFHLPLYASLSSQQQHSTPDF